MRLLLPLLAIIMNCYSHSFIPHDPTQSTRDVQLKILAANGCTNRLVALQVIDFYQSGHKFISVNGNVAPEVVTDELKQLVQKMTPES